MGHDTHREGGHGVKCVGIDLGGNKGKDKVGNTICRSGGVDGAENWTNELM